MSDKYIVVEGSCKGMTGLYVYDKVSEEDDRKQMVLRTSDADIPFYPELLDKY